ncbi:unnamed protein product, partial [Mesorhabditis spiculigera]
MPMTVDESELDTVQDLLLKMKRLAHRKVYGNREFGSDSVVDNAKPISISYNQPDVKKELTPFIADPEARWDPTETIRYRFHESLEFFAISQVINAIQYWESHSCLSFEQVPGDLSDDEDFIEFFKGQGCYSMIGRNGGRQGVSIGDNCAKQGIVEHEVGHALGLWHEQSRPDALNFIEVERDFILPSFIGDFQQRFDEIDTLGVPYDLGSVMHYGSTAFSTDQKSKTILTRDPLYQSTIGQRETLSFYDLQKINIVYCADKCAGSGTQCANGGYPHPRKCSQCICPTGFGGPNCEENEPSQNADCGGVLNLGDDWMEFSSPDFPDPGFQPDQKCAWVMKAPAGLRVEMEFIEDFSFLCTSICNDYVELKLAADHKNTGFRFCCSTMPTGSFVSENHLAVAIFRSQIASDVGFKLRARATELPARTTPAPIQATTVAPRITIEGTNIWADWGSWSECSRSCGGCGIRSRKRECRTKECDGKRQEFASCNLVACPVDKNCARLLSNQKVCAGGVCNKLGDVLSRCLEPQCCPPFYNNNGVCVNDAPTSGLTRRS